MTSNFYTYLKRKIKIQHIVLLSFLWLSFNINAQDESFEGTVPAHWTTTNGSLSTSTDHYKLDNKSLRWDWSANAVLTVHNIQSHGLVASEVLGFYENMFRMWVYNTAAIQTAPLTIEFYDNTGALRFYYNFQLNYTGWRAASASYKFEMSGNKSSTNITSMKLKAPTSGSGTFFFDYIDYTMGRNNSRNPDYQLPFINLDNNEHWADIMYFQSLTKTIPLATPTAEEISDLSIVKQKYDALILGNPPSNATVSSAISKYKALNISYSGGIVKGKPIYGKDYSNSQNLYVVEEFLLNLARHYKHTSSTTSKNYFLNTVRYFLDQGYAEGSLMETIHHIGYSFRNIPSAIHLMKAELEVAGLWSQSQKMVEWYSALDGIWHPTAADSNMDDGVTRAIPRLGACIYKTTNAEKVQYLKGYKTYIENFFSLYPKESEGMKIDFTGFHHNTYYPGYTFLTYNGLSQAIQYISDGVFAISTNKREVLKKSLLLARVISAGGDIPNSLSGRNPFVNPSFKNGLKNLGLANPVDTDVIKAYNYLYGSDAQTLSYGVETPPNGFWQVNFANLGVYRQGNWVADIKGFNKYFWGTEIYSNANRYGRYQSYGAVEIMYKGGHTNSKLNRNGWDWNKTPGATTKHLSWNDLNAANSRQDERTDSNFAASLRFGNKGNYYIDEKIEGNYGVFGMDFSQKNITASHDASFKFKKSVFCFDGKLICLGSNIQSSNGLIATNLFQNFLSATSLPINVNNTTVTTFPYNTTLSNASKNWIIDAANTGYFIKSGNDIIIDRKNQDSPNQSGNGTTTNGDFASAYISHGTSPKNAGYEYVIIPDTNSADMATFSANMDANNTVFYQVIQKNQTAHIVKYKDMYGYSLFEDGSYGTSTPIKENYGSCLVMAKETGNQLKISVASPDLNFTANNGNSQLNVIDLTINGEWHIEKSSGGKVTVNENTGETILMIEVKEGLPVDISLTKGYVNPQYPIIYYEDFRYGSGNNGFTRRIVSDGGHTDLEKIINRAGDVPDLADTNNLFDPSVSRPENRIPQGGLNNQRCITTRGDDGTVNFAVDAYAVFTTLDLTDANPLIATTDTYKYASFWTERRYGEGDIATITMLVSTDYAGNPATASWNVLPLHSGKLADTSDARKYVKGVVDLTSYANRAGGKQVTLAMRYQGSSSAYSSSNRNGTFYISDLKFTAQSSTLSNTYPVLKKKELLVFPNPTNSILNIQFSDSNIQIKKVCLIDVFGKIIYSNKNVKSIDVNDFSKGVYFLSVETNKDNAFNKKIIIN